MGDIPKGHETSLDHDGVLNRWCAVQADVEDYFRKTLPQVFARCLRSPLALDPCKRSARRPFEAVICLDHEWVFSAHHDH